MKYQEHEENDTMRSFKVRIPCKIIIKIIAIGRTRMAGNAGIQHDRERRRMHKKYR
jgi:hypothetical protein